ncbi:hypothetical protein [Streptomyces zhihengii]|uniref:hypothetical protein n=1 Tax=Streptomyces zhihengii TaxID=1818004 RepID=UPI0033B467DC
MPRHAQAPTKTYVCPECGRKTRASLRNGHLYEHPAPDGSGPCAKSGHIVLSGSELVGHYECACGTWARITHKKALAQHSMPEGEHCPLSGEPIQAPPARPVVKGLLRPVPPAPARGWAKPVTTAGGASVYAIPAGLPGLGRRR